MPVQVWCRHTTTSISIEHLISIMSVKLSVELELPLEDIANIQSGDSTANVQRSVLAANQATVSAIRAMPYNLTSANPTPSATCTPSATIDTTTADVETTYSSKSEPYFQFFVWMTMTGKILDLELPLSSTVEELKSLVQDKEGISPCAQRFVFAGRQLEDRRHLADVRDIFTWILSTH